LKKVCNEIFGEENFIDYFLWTKTSTPPSLSNKSRKTVEFVLCFEKNKNNYRYYGSGLDNGDAPLLNTSNPRKDLVFPAGSINFTFIKSAIFAPDVYDRVELKNQLIIKDGKNTNEIILNGEFKWGQDNLTKELELGTYFLIKTDKFSIRFQRVENEKKYKTPNKFLDIELNKEVSVGTNESAVKELDCLDLNGIFDYPKPVSLLDKLIKTIAKDDKKCIIMDFFSGSATTAHAIMQLNAEDGGKRKFIMVQLPEPTDENSEAYKAGYKNICEIGKERIRRAGEKINTGIMKNNAQQKIGEEPKQPVDIGFKVLKLDSSNIKKWNPDYDDLEKALYNNINNYVDGRTEFDVVYEIMLKYGLNLTYPIDELDIGGKKAYSIAYGMLIICLDNDITMDVANEIVKLKKQLNPEEMRVVFKDNGFLNDSVKTNVKEILKCANIKEFVTI
jgi:adenine-specific DNA-methyltransferase